MEVYDFSGYATKANVRCSDGRTILPDAFVKQNGMKVPLLWQHGHTDQANVIGHAYLEARPDGMYVYAKFNETENGKMGKEQVKHGDIEALSIHADSLIERAKQVFHGVIREVSLVIAGANPGAYIDNIVMAHSNDGADIIDAIIYMDQGIEHEQPKSEETLSHADTTSEDDTTLTDIFESLTDPQKDLFYLMLGEMSHSDGSPEVVNEAVEDAESQESTANQEVTEDEKSKEDGIQHSRKEEGVIVTNVFETAKANKDGESLTHSNTLTHANVQEIFKMFKATGSLKEAINDYTLTHGIDNIDLLFPEAKALTSTPEFIKRRTEWVADVMSNVNHTPFSRIKTMFADITMEEARAKGYIKGNFKKEEFFGLTKRETGPQTIYKKQKLDRDDVIDITDFDVVMWLKGEMRLMLEEEIARAILIGDGRSLADDDKIMPDKVRAIATDAELFQTTVYVSLDDATPNSSEEVIDALTLHRRHYRGSGNPTFYTSETMLAKMLLIKDADRHRIYKSVDDLCVAIRCKNIIAIEAFEDQGDLLGIMVNLQDYSVGADKGGAVSMFDDFDLDYNKLLYLIETRISGALTKYKSALVVRQVASTAALVSPVAPTFDANEVTVATTTGVTYKNKLTNTTLTTASPVVLGVGESLTVLAIPASSSYYFATSDNDEWTFEYQA